MKRSFKPIVFVLFALVIALSLSGCNAIGGIFDPRVGTWMGGIGGVTVTVQLNADKSFNEVMIDNSNSTEMLLGGTYSYDDGTKKLTMTLTTYSIDGTDQPLSGIPGIDSDNSVTVTFEVNGDVATMSGGNMPTGTFTLLRI